MDMRRFLIAIILLATVFPVAAQTNLNVVAIHGSSTSFSFSWDNVSSPWVVAFSSDNFTSQIASGTLSSNSTSYTSLIPNTTYWFRAKANTESDASYPVNTISSITYASIPENLSISYKSALSSNSAEIRVAFDTQNPPYTIYQIEYSSAPPINTITINGIPPLTIPDLLANTTYTVKIKAIDILGRSLGYSTEITTSTLAIMPNDLDNSIFETSSTLNWTALNSSINETSCEGYAIIVSTNADFRDSVYEWNTIDKNTSSNDIIGLSRNTTYYMRFGSLNWNQEKNFFPQQFTTLTSKLSSFSLIYLSSSASRLSWDPLPASPPENSADGYLLEASTSSDFYPKISTKSYSISENSLAFSNLDPNTTYYFHAASINQAGNPNYTNYIETVTLSMTYQSSDIGVISTTKSVSAYFTSLPSYPEALSGKGYRLEVSTMPFTTGVILSSTSLAIETSLLTVDNLKGNTTYYLRLGTFNRSMTINYSPILKTTTLIPPAVSYAYISTKTFDSVTVNYLPGDTDGYILEAALDEFFTSIYKSSSTTSSSLSTLTVSVLSSNTSYYFRLGALFQGATVYNYEPGSAYTLAPIPISPSISQVFISSINISWGTISSSGYTLEASTSPDFSGIVNSSSTYNSSLGSLTVSGLVPNTTYYLRVGSLNKIGERNFNSAPSTVTLANFPIQVLPFKTSDLSTESIKINWSANSNPPDTLYRVRISSYSNFTNTVFSSDTLSTFAIFDNLQPNTTFFQEITAFNRRGRLTGPIEFSSVATLAYDPMPASEPQVYISSLNFSWAYGLNPPPPNTLYLAEISSSNFLDSIISSRTLNLSASFSGLVSNATYYLRVSALNQSDIPSNYLIVGSTLTYIQTPAAKTADIAFSNPTLDGFTLSWYDNGNSQGSLYIVEASTISDFSFTASSASTTQLEYTFSRLNFNTQYYTRIRAIGARGELSSWANSGSTFTLSNVQSKVYPENDTILSLPYSYGNIEVRIPPNSIGGATKIILEPEISFPQALSNAGKLKATGLGIKLRAYPPTIFDKPVTITIPYRNSDMPFDIDKNRLVVATYGENSGLWVPLNSISDTVNRKVSGETFHFSIFQIMELTPGSDLSQIKIYPNPFKPNSTGGVMHFTNLPPNTKIKIFTVSGELIAKIKAGADGMAQWDGKNENGNNVASGVYIGLFTSPDGKKKFKKMAVER